MINDMNCMKALPLHGGRRQPSYYLLFICLLFHPSLSVSAQQTFTDYLARRVAGEGTVVLHHDAELDALVNGQVSYASIASPRAHKPVSAILLPDTIPADSGSSVVIPTFGRRVRSTGFRIQVYAGSNTRQSKSEANRMASLVRSTFEDVNVYTRFISPRWTCRVGDFKTREEAVELLRRMRETRKFPEASIVKSQIILIY